MKKTIIIFSILFLLSYGSFAQYIKKIAVFNSNTISYSGIFGMNDTAIYNFSSYFHEWLPITNNGLVRKNNIVQLKSLAVYNDGTSTTEGLYVISDTAVFNYSWYLHLWQPLSNTGLIRHQDTVQLSDISLFQYEAGANDGVFVVSDTAVFQYSWYEHLWHPLSNSGLNASVLNTISPAFEMHNFPNPFQLETTISYTLPVHYNDRIKIVLYRADGSVVQELVNEIQREGQHNFNLKTAGLQPGIYFYEICGSNFKQAKKLIRIE